MAAFSLTLLRKFKAYIFTGMSNFPGIVKIILVIFVILILIVLKKRKLIKPKNNNFYISSTEYIYFGYIYKKTVKYLLEKNIW